MMRPYHLVAPAIAQNATMEQAETSTPATTMLRAPAPNPAATGASFRFTLGEPGTVELDLYAVTGQRLRRLANTRYDAGEHTVSWDGRDDGGRPIAPGMYFIMLKANGVSQSRKLMLSR